MEPMEILAKLSETGTPPDSESAFRISVGLDDTIVRFHDEVLPFAAKGGSELQFVYAPYGRGKTHFLRTLQEIAKRQGFVTAYVDCHSGQVPFLSLQETYRIVASNMLPPSKTNVSPGRMGVDVIIEEAFLLASREQSQQYLQNIFDNNYLASDFRNLVAAFGRMVIQNVHREFTGFDLRSLLRSNKSTSVRVNDIYRFNPWIQRPIGKLGKRNASSWVRSLSSLPQSLGYPGLVILFDETERTPSMNTIKSRKRRAHLANLRNFVDHLAIGTFQSCIIFYAVVEDFLEIAKTELTALCQRIERIRLSRNEVLQNPRAVWVDLDEFTDPSPREVSFYESLGRAIVRIGVDAGLASSLGDAINRRLNGLSPDYANSINSGAVREFVKMAASLVAKEV